jgi:hypothetical protein
MANTPKFESHTLPTALAMTTPAVRMVVVEMWGQRPERFEETEGPDAMGNWPDEPRHRFIPVLALVGRHVDDYSRRATGSGPPLTAPTWRGMHEKGWVYEGFELKFDALILEENYGLILASDAYASTANVVYDLAVCPWPADEDEDRLAPIVAELREGLRGKLAMAEPNPR